MIDHDCNIGDFCHVGVGAHLAGTVNIEVGTFIGAGATVISDISEQGAYVGVPAKRIK